MCQDDDMRCLVGDHGPIVVRILASLERNVENREDLWIEVFRIAFEKRKDLRNLEPAQRSQWFRTVARRVAHNAARAAATRQKTVERVLREPMVDVPSAEDDYLTVDLRESEIAKLETAIGRVDERQREALVMNALGHSAPEIARVLDVSPQTMRLRLMRGRRALKAAGHSLEQEAP